MKFPVCCKWGHQPKVPELSELPSTLIPSFIVKAIVISMDADLQDDINVIDSMVEEYNNFVGHLLDYQFVAVLDGKGQMPQVTDACYDVDWFTLDELKSIPVFPDVKTRL